MLRKPSIAMGLDEMTNSEVLVTAKRVAKMLTGNPFYPTINPSLATFENLVAVYATALSRWGVSNNKGSSIDKLNCDSARRDVEVALTTIIYFCRNATPYNAEAFLSAGFVLKRDKQPLLSMGPVRDLHQDKNVQVNFGEAFLRWRRPLGVHRHLVKCYQVFRNTTASFSTAKMVMAVTKTKFTDRKLTGPHYYYWVVPVGASSGSGTISDLCLACVTICPE